MHRRINPTDDIFLPRGHAPLMRERDAAWQTSELLCFLESLAYVLSLFHVFTSCSIRISEFLRLREDTIIFYEDFAADGEAVPAAVCERDVV